VLETLADFKREYLKICSIGWIKTHRSGNTGIGKTLEDMVGITENNANLPDFGIYELKSARIDNHAMLTLFTKSPETSKSVTGNNYLLDSFGYFRPKSPNKKTLYSTLCCTKFVAIYSSGKCLKVGFDNEKIFLVSHNGLEDIYWTRETLKKTFESKYASNQIVYAKAKSRGLGAKEEFKYEKAYLLGGFSFESFTTLLEQGRIFIDLRIGQFANGNAHDRGTAFRIRECDQDLLFLSKQEIV